MMILSSFSLQRGCFQQIFCGSGRGRIFIRSLSTSPVTDSALKTRSFYDDLGIHPQSTSREIKDAFYKLSKEYHPDKNVDNPDALAKFQAISEAYELLSNPGKRVKYDKGVLGRDSSVAEREAASHRFEGETFYGSRGSTRVHHDMDIDRNLDSWMRETKKESFELKLRQRNYTSQQKDQRLSGLRGKSTLDRKQLASNMKTNQSTDGKLVFMGTVMLLLYIVVRLIFF